MSINSGCVFCNALQELNTDGKHHKVLVRLGKTQSSLQELEVNVARFRDSNTVAAIPAIAVTRREGELAAHQAQHKCDLAALQAKSSTDPDTLQAVAKYSIQLQLLLDAEPQNAQCVEPAITDLQICVVYHSTFVDTAGKHLHFSIPLQYDLCVQIILVKFARRFRNSGVA